jgi:hypothetical protein
MLVRAVFENVLLPVLVKVEVGVNMTLVRLVQLENVLAPRFVTLLGIVTLVKLLQPTNAAVPRSSNPVPIVRLVRPEQP